MKKLFQLIGRLSRSRGFEPPRLIFTAVYTFGVTFSIPLFSASYGRYFMQAISIAMLVASLILLIRSLKLMFDTAVRERINRVASRVSRAVGDFFRRFIKKITNALGLGLGLTRARGSDERDFVFREKRSGRRRLRRVRNPYHWSELGDNAMRVRYIFTDFMLGRMRRGYRLPPDRTPDDISRELAADDGERLLFSAYRSARYSGGHEPVPDETVSRLLDIDAGSRRRKLPSGKNDVDDATTLSDE